MAKCYHLLNPGCGYMNFHHFDFCLLCVWNISGWIFFLGEESKEVYLRQHNKKGLVSWIELIFISQKKSQWAKLIGWQAQWKPGLKIYKIYSLSSWISIYLVCLWVFDYRRAYNEKYIYQKVVFPSVIRSGDEWIRDDIRHDLKQIIQIKQNFLKLSEGQ